MQSSRVSLSSLWPSWLSLYYKVLLSLLLKFFWRKTTQQSFNQSSESLKFTCKLQRTGNLAWSKYWLYKFKFLWFIPLKLFLVMTYDPLFWTFQSLSRLQNFHLSQRDSPNHDLPALERLRLFWQFSKSCCSVFDIVFILIQVLVSLLPYSLHLLWWLEATYRTPSFSNSKISLFEK